MATTLLRFKDLKARGIVGNWPTLLRWINTLNFPSGMMLGPNTRAWTDEEIESWLESRRIMLGQPNSGQVRDEIPFTPEGGRSDE